MTTRLLEGDDHEPARQKAALRGPGERDRGGATVWVLAAGLVTVLVALAMAAVGAAIVARHRAQAAADLAALGGAAHAIEGEPVACARAAELVEANGGRMLSCQLDGWDLTVSAEVVPASVAAFAGTARASARAGPVEAAAEAPDMRRREGST